MADRTSIPSYSYSVAIRTLGTAGDKFRKELESLCFQTIPPERVLVYIAEGYARPQFTMGREEYRWVKKGMMAQRILCYDDISSDCILMLDDDVVLAPDCAEKMLRALMDHDADCVGADVFQNHRMPLKTKLFAAITNLVFPHWDRKWAFKMHRNGSFSYNIRPEQTFYWSQSCGGPAAIWRKDSFLRMRFDEELWLEALGFPYGEDALMFYKLHSNSGRLGVLYDSGITNQDAQSSSGAFRKSPDYIYIRTKASLMTWWRMCYKTGKDTVASRLPAALSFGFKTLWLVPVILAAAFIKWDRNFVTSYGTGLRDGWREVHSPEFRQLPPYIA